jgi:hypothetical protein
MISTTAFSSTTKLDQKSKTEIVKQELVSVDVLANVEFTGYEFPVVSVNKNETVLVSIVEAKTFLVINPISFCEDVGWRYCRINYKNKEVLPLEPGLTTEKVRIRNDAKA